MSVIVPMKIYEVLNKVVSNNIENYSVSSEGSNKKGEGFMSVMNYVSLNDKSTGKELNFVVKQAFIDEPARKDYPIRSYYLNEIHFYDKVWPALEEFQNQIPAEKRFDKVPKCFATVSDDKDEKLVLENLKYQHFSTINKTSTLDKDLMEYIFKEYGKFHALSFAYKELNLEGYLEISRDLKELWTGLNDTRGFKDSINFLHGTCLKNLDPEEDAAVTEKYKHYSDDGADIFHNSHIYKGNYSVILHGDCWSNNMMFKYDESKKVVDMKLLDFQFSNVGTPASDLSYCLYSGASNEILDDLDHYLRVYHDSLLETVKEFGCDTKNVYPFEELKKDWKEHCKMGFTMGLIVWRGKLTNEGEIKDLTDLEEDPDANKEHFLNVGYDEETFKKRTRDLILHMYENDFL